MIRWPRQKIRDDESVPAKYPELLCHRIVANDVSLRPSTLEHVVSKWAAEEMFCESLVLKICGARKLSLS